MTRRKLKEKLIEAVGKGKTPSGAKHTVLTGSKIPLATKAERESLTPTDMRLILASYDSLNAEGKAYVNRHADAATRNLWRALPKVANIKTETPMFKNRRRFTISALNKTNKDQVNAALDKVK